MEEFCVFDHIKKVTYLTTAPFLADLLTTIIKKSRLHTFSIEKAMSRSCHRVSIRKAIPLLSPMDFSEEDRRYFSHFDRNLLSGAIVITPSSSLEFEGEEVNYAFFPEEKTIGEFLLSLGRTLFLSIFEEWKAEYYPFPEECTPFFTEGYPSFSDFKNFIKWMFNNESGKVIHQSVIFRG